MGGKGASYLKKLLRKGEPFLMVFKVPSRALRKIEHEQSKGIEPVKPNDFGISSSESESHRSTNNEVHTPSFSSIDEEIRMELVDESTRPMSESATQIPEGKTLDRKQYGQSV